MPRGRNDGFRKKNLASETWHFQVFCRYTSVFPTLDLLIYVVENIGGGTVDIHPRCMLLHPPPSCMDPSVSFLMNNFESNFLQQSDNKWKNERKIDWKIDTSAWRAIICRGRACIPEPHPIRSDFQFQIWDFRSTTFETAACDVQPGDVDEIRLHVVEVSVDKGRVDLHDLENGRSLLLPLATPELSRRWERKQKERNGMNGMERYGIDWNGTRTMPQPFRW